MLRPMLPKTTFSYSMQISVNIYRHVLRFSFWFYPQLWYAIVSLDIKNAQKPTLKKNKHTGANVNATPRMSRMPFMIIRTDHLLLKPRFCGSHRSATLFGCFSNWNCHTSPYLLSLFIVRTLYTGRTARTPAAISHSTQRQRIRAVKGIRKWLALAHAQPQQAGIFLLF